MKFTHFSYSFYNSITDTFTDCNKGRLFTSTNAACSLSHISNLSNIFRFSFLFTLDAVHVIYNYINYFETITKFLPSDSNRYTLSDIVVTYTSVFAGTTSRNSNLSCISIIPTANFSL